MKIFGAILLFILGGSFLIMAFRSKYSSEVVLQHLAGALPPIVFWLRLLLAATLIWGGVMVL